MSSNRIVSILGCSVEDALRVDRHVLDDLWERHPDLVWRVNEELTNATRARDDAKAEADRVDADVSESILSDIARSGEKNPTVDRLKRLIASNKDSQDAWSHYLDCKQYAERLLGLQSALAAKQSALKHLSELYHSNYFVANHSRPQGRTYLNRPSSDDVPRDTVRRRLPN